MNAVNLESQWTVLAVVVRTVAFVQKLCSEWLMVYQGSLQAIDEAKGA